MRIENLRKENRENRTRVSVTVIWEDTGRPDCELYFETTEAFADDITSDPNGFLIGCILPAMANGEQRISVAGRLCPELVNNLAVAAGWLQTWYGPPRRAIKVESTRGIDSKPQNKPPRAASFLSGGIDSLAALRHNRLAFSYGHPRSIRDCLILHGFDMGVTEHEKSGEHVFDRTVANLDHILRETDVTLIPVYTNIRELDGNVEKFKLEYHGAMLASAAHMFSHRLSSVFISASVNYRDFVPWGSHPLLDPNYSSTGLQVLHHGFQFSRLEKVRMVSQWPAGLGGLRVCIRNPYDRINCGECHKCIRTMLELYVCGKLADAPTFPADNMEVGRVQKLRPGIFKDHAEYFREMYPHLRRMGRSDLVDVLEKRMRQYRYLYAPAERLGLIKFLKKQKIWQKTQKCRT